MLVRRDHNLRNVTWDHQIAFTCLVAFELDQIQQDFQVSDDKNQETCEVIMIRHYLKRKACFLQFEVKHRIPWSSTFPKMHLDHHRMDFRMWRCSWWVFFVPCCFALPTILPKDQKILSTSCWGVPHRGVIMYIRIYIYSTYIYIVNVYILLDIVSAIEIWSASPDLAFTLPWPPWMLLQLWKRHCVHVELRVQHLQIWM